MAVGQNQNLRLHLMVVAAVEAEAAVDSEVVDSAVANVEASAGVVAVDSAVEAVEAAMAEVEVEDSAIEMVGMEVVEAEGLVVEASGK